MEEAGWKDEVGSGVVSIPEIALFEELARSGGKDEHGLHAVKLKQRALGQWLGSMLLRLLSTSVDFPLLLVAPFGV